MDRWYVSGKVRFVLTGLFLSIFIVAALSSSSLSLSAQGGSWEGKYWNNRNLSGDPALTRQDASINFDWGAGSPSAEIAVDNFSAQWTQTANLPGGTYRFTASTDDGMRVWIDNVMIIDAWFDSQVHTITADVFLSAGTHTIVVHYYEAGGLAVAKMNYVLLGASPTPPPPADQPWYNEYFANTNLSGTPALTGTTSAVNFNWGFGSPAPGFPADFFSVRWVRDLALDAGRYRFTVTSDDGVRVWVNNNLIIDQWRTQAATTFNAEIDLGGGTVPIRVEYYENTERAQIALTWTKISSPPAPPPAGAYRAEYFNNMTLSGSPVLVRDEAAVNYNWGHGSPAPQVPIDHFSARWTTTLNLSPGRYRFSASSDDGVRVWVNNQIIIDAWFDRPVRTFTGEYDVNGAVSVRIEYYENTNLAEMRFSYSLVSGQPGTGGPFPGTATVTSYRLNVRRGPGTNFAIITKLSTGNVVNLTGFRNGDATWVQVSLPNGTVGWVSALYIHTTIPIGNLTPITGTTPPPAPPPTGATGTVVTGALNVRTGPGIGFGAFTTISNGATVTLLGRNNDASWVKVILPDGRQGWVNASFLSTSVPIVNLPVINI
ncbi:MAG: SH3 domain-containing protein [Anaerolineales bacterium]|nr:SH3 domain-containing protein [Anaerolineales bacterium]MCB8934936.1 SH3 domain-containing protein [Promineifilum sp.]